MGFVLMLLVSVVCAEQLSTIPLSPPRCTGPEHECDSAMFLEAQQTANENAVTKFNQAATTASFNQSIDCTKAVSEAKPQCDKSHYDTLISKINFIKESITKEKELSAQAFLRFDQGQSIGEIKQVLVDSLRELAAFNTDLQKHEEELAALNENCNIPRLMVNNFCQPPTVEQNGTQPIIVRTKHNGNMTTVERTPIQAGEGVQGLVVARAVIEKSGEVSTAVTDEIKKQRDDFNTKIDQSANETFEIKNTTSLLVRDVYTQTKMSLDSLKTFNTRETDSSGGCDETATDCSPSPNPTPSPTPTRPDPVVTPIARPTNNDDGSNPNPEGSNQFSETESTGGQSAKELIEQNQNKSYGGTTPPAMANDSSILDSTPTPGGGSWLGRIGNTLSGLTGLAPMFAKTNGGGNNNNGGFGNDSSYASNRAGARYASKSDIRSGNSQLSPNGFGYQPNNKSGQNLRQKTVNGQGFNPQFDGANPYNGGNSGGGGSLGLGSSNARRSSSSKKEQPGLFSKLLGKKDKTLFGNKNTKGGSAGSYSGSASGRSGGSIYDDPSAPQLQKTGNGRIFDPNKYAPSKAAEAQAYARHTGRKIASHSSPSAYPAPISWPADINRNKKINLFFTNGLQVKMTVNNTK